MMALGAVVALLFLQGQDPEALSESALKLAQAGRTAEAAKLWKKALTVAPQHFPSLFNLGFMYSSQKNFPEAELYLARAAKEKPDDFNTRYMLGSVLAGAGKREAGLVEWRAALAVQPQNVRLMMIMAVEYSKGLYFREACAVARRAVASRGESLETHLVAIKACGDAQDPGVLEMTRTAAARFPDNARANFEYGFQLQKAGRREEALPFIKRAMEGDESYEEPLFFYGDLLLLEDRYDEAAVYLKKALAIRPDYVAACVSLAKALMATERLPEAAEELKGCAVRNPVHPQPHLLMSQVYFRMGEEERAQQEKMLSMKLRRENPAIMETPQGRAFPSKAGQAGRPVPRAK